MLLTAAAWLLPGMDGKNAWRIFKRDRFNHASPNSAQGEAACAGALHLRLAGDAWYLELFIKSLISAMMTGYPSRRHPKESAALCLELRDF